MLTAIAVLAALGSAFADDRWDKRSGGLALLPLDDGLTVEAVELMLSPGEIRLTYRIHNAGKTRNLLGITFPMPDVRGELFGEADYAAPIPDGFRLTRDGRPVEGTLHQYVTALGVDRTDIVRELGLALNPAFGTALAVPGSFEAALNPPPTLTAEQRDRLLRLGMIRPLDLRDHRGTGPATAQLLGDVDTAFELHRRADVRARRARGICAHLSACRLDEPSDTRSL